MQENGTLKAVKEKYLIGAMNFTEAEARTIEELTPYINGEISISNIVKTRIHELFTTVAILADKFYKVKIAITTIDEKTGAEKLTTSTMLVQAENFHNANARFLSTMEKTMMNNEIISITESGIKEYFPYKQKE